MSDSINSTSPIPVASASAAIPSSSSSSSSSSSQFVNKVSTLPLVSSAWGVAWNIYEGTKERYQVVGKVEGMVEGFVPHVVQVTSKATPEIVTKGLTQLDSFACASLDVLEQRVPLIKEQPSVIASSVTERVTQGVGAVDDLVGKALIYSEQKMDYLLPEEKEAQVKATVAVNDEAEGAVAPTPVASQLNGKKQKAPHHIARVQQLGVTLSKRLSKRAQRRLMNPKEVSIEMVVKVTSIVETQLGKLKSSFDAALVQGEKKTNIAKTLDGYFHELRASFAHAVEAVEKMNAKTAVMETGFSILENLSHSITQFVSKVDQTLHQLQGSTQDPILKKVLEGAFNSLHYIQSYSKYLNKMVAKSSGKSIAVESVSLPEEAPIADTPLPEEISS